MLNLDDIALACDGKIVQQGATEFRQLTNDTRKDLSGSIYIALVGETFDGHGFVSDAVAKGANGVIVKTVPNPLPANTTVIQVGDTLTALQQIARAHRRRFRIPILALTGSNGKTTTKEFTAQILAPFRKVHYSQGSFNNHFGVPFSLLEMNSEHQVGVFEVGMNHAGEIQNLIGLIEPTAVACTTVGRAHMEFFGSEAEIAKAKEEIYRFSPSSSTRIYNLDNSHVRAMHDRHAKLYPASPALTFSTAGPADIVLQIKNADLTGLTIEGKIKDRAVAETLPIFGRQNVANLAAACALALSAGLSADEVARGLVHCRTSWGRNQILRTSNGALVLFDAYNANPDSMKALIGNVRDMAKHRRVIGIFGQMGEQGDDSPRAHRELGEWLAEPPFAEVLFFGEDHTCIKPNTKIQTFAEFNTKLLQDLAATIRPDDLIVIKGSRSVALERALPIFGIHNPKS